MLFFYTKVIYIVGYFLNWNNSWSFALCSLSLLSFCKCPHCDVNKVLFLLLWLANLLPWLQPVTRHDHIGSDEVGLHSAIKRIIKERWINYHLWLINLMNQCFNAYLTIAERSPQLNLSCFNFNSDLNRSSSNQVHSAVFDSTAAYDLYFPLLGRILRCSLAIC